MKNNSFAALMVGLLSLSATATVVMALIFASSTRHLRSLQPTAIAAQARLNLAQALLNDTIEYSKHNPAIEPVLQTLAPKTNGVVPGPGTR